MQKFAVVYFPEISKHDIDTFRKKYDPGWNIISPHITIVSPVSGVSEEQLVEHIESTIKDIASFSIHLTGLTKSFDDYLFLQVKEGNEKIVNVHEKLYTGKLAPYLQTDFRYIPHITLGYFGKENNGSNKELYETGYKEAESMKINITSDFDNITLIKGNGITPAKIIKTFNLNK